MSTLHPEVMRWELEIKRTPKSVKCVSLLVEQLQRLASNFITPLWQLCLNIHRQTV